MKNLPPMFQFMIAGFATGAGLIIWAYIYFYPRAEARVLREEVKSLHTIHREDMREVKDYLREIRDAIRQEN